MLNIMLIYNILITILLSVTMMGFYVIYVKDRSKEMIFLGILMALMFMDNLIIYLSEFSESFESLYFTTDVIYVAVYLVFIGMILAGRLSIAFLWNRPIMKAEGFILGIFVAAVTVLSVLIPFAYVEWLFYGGFFISLFYLSWISKIGLPMKLVLWMTFFSFAGVVEATLYFLSYFEPETQEAVQVSLEYRSFSLDALKIILVILGFKLINLRLNTSASEEKELTLEERIDTFCHTYDLTERQKEIVTLIVQGDSNKQIGETLHVTEGTVKTHVHHIFRKTEVSSRNQLMGRVMHRK